MAKAPLFRELGVSLRAAASGDGASLGLGFQNIESEALVRVAQQYKCMGNGEHVLPTGPLPCGATWAAHEDCRACLPLQPLCNAPAT